jgi:hypothetical protein
MRLQTWSTALIVGLALVCLGTSPVAAQDLDSVKADAAHHKVEFENDQVRVVRYHYEPEEKSAMPRTSG